MGSSLLCLFSKSLLFYSHCFQLLLQFLFFLCFLFGGLRDHLRGIGRYFLRILFKLGHVDLHARESAGLEFLHNHLDGLRFLHKHDDVFSGAIHANVFLDASEFSLDKFLVRQFEVAVGDETVEGIWFN